MHEPTHSERLRRALWTAIAEDAWADTDLDAAICEYVGDAREHEQPLAEICRALRVHVQQVGIGLSAARYETVARHVTALAETAFRGEFRGHHVQHTVRVPGSEDDG